MLKFIVRRIFWTIPVLLVVIFLTFVMMRQIEGNPFRKTERAVPESVQRNLERKFNLDKPWWQQYLYYVKGVFTLDLGPSLVIRGRDVNDIVKTHFPKSIELGFYAFVFAIVVGVPLGMIAALKQNTWVDYTAMFFSNVFHAIPSFLVATLLIYFIALKCGRVTDERLDELGITRSCPRSRSASRRWRSSRGSSAGRCSRRCTRTTCAPHGPRASATGASSACTCSGTR